MTEEKINVLRYENNSINLESLNTLELMDILKKMSYNCKIDDENMRGFYDMFERDNKPPSINSFDEILINYILSDSDSIPYVKLDVSVNSTQLWDYYTPKDVPVDTVRISLLQPKRVLVLRDNDTTIPLIMPRGQTVDISSINLIKVDEIRSIFNTVKHRQIKKRMYPNHGLIRQISGLYTPEPLKYIELDEYMNHFVNEINSVSPIYGKGFTSIYQFISTTLSRNLILKYINYIHEDKIDPTILQHLRMDTDFRKKNALNNINRSKEEIKSFALKNLIKTHFPQTYYPHNPRNTYHDLFKQMSDKSIAFIQREYEVQEDYKLAVDANRCPHLEILRRFRLTKDFKMRRKWYLELKPFISNPSETKGYHTCKRCKFNIICPHITQSIDSILNNVPSIEIRDKLEWYRNKMDGGKYQYLCRICSEVLFDINIEEIQGETYKLLYKDIFKYLWAQTLNIYSTLHITPKVNIFDFCSIIVYGILPIITRSSIPEIKHKMNLYLHTGDFDIEFKIYIVLYIYAYVLNMIRFNISHSKSTYVQIQLDENVRGRDISNYAKVVVARFLTIHRPLFSQVADIDSANLLITIYTELVKNDSAFSMVIVNSLETIVFNEVVKNTLFNYSLRIATMTGKVDIKNSELSVSNYENMVNDILGMRILDISRGKVKNTYHKLYQPSYDRPEVKLYQSVLSKSTIKLKDLKLINKGRSIYSYGLYMRKFLQGGDDILKPLFESEKKIKGVASLFYKIPTKTLDATKKWIKRTYTSDTNITAIYNEDGKEYKWDEVYNDNRDLIDYKDSATGIFRSETQKQNLNKTREAYYRNRKKLVFFNFYKIKCPESSVHSFNGDGICSKCNLARDQQSEKYYTKYYDTFLKESVELVRSESSVRENDTQKIKNKHADWKYNVRPIVEISKLISQPQSVLESIGAMEGRTIEDIKLNQLRPPPPNSLYDPQFTLLVSHYQWSISMYNKIIFNDIGGEQIFIKHMNSVGITVNDISNIKHELSRDLFVSYNEVLDTVTRSDKFKMADKYLCAVEMMCSFLIDLAKINNITKEVSKFLINSIIQDEFYTTKGSKNFDRSVFKSVTSVFLGSQDTVEIYEDLDDSKFEMKGDLSYEDVDIIINT